MIIKENNATYIKYNDKTYAIPRPFTSLLETMKAFIRFFLVAWAVRELWSVKKQKSSRASQRYSLQPVRVNPTLHG